MSNPIVTFEMENGKTFKAELYPEKAPNTVTIDGYTYANDFHNLKSKFN